MEYNATVDYLMLRAHQDARLQLAAGSLHLEGPSADELVLENLRVTIQPPRIVPQRAEAKELAHVFTWHKVHALFHLIGENYDTNAQTSFLSIVRTNGILTDAEVGGIEKALFIEPQP